MSGGRLRAMMLPSASARRLNRATPPLSRTSMRSTPGRRAMSRRDFSRPDSSAFTSKGAAALAAVRASAPAHCDDVWNAASAARWLDTAYSAHIATSITATSSTSIWCRSRLGHRAASGDAAEGVGPCHGSAGSGFGQDARALRGSSSSRAENWGRWLLMRSRSATMASGAIEEGVHHQRVEEAAAFAGHHLQRLRVLDGGAVAAVHRQRVEVVDRGDDAPDSGMAAPARPRG